MEALWRPRFVFGCPHSAQGRGDSVDLGFNTVTFVRGRCTRRASGAVDVLLQTNLRRAHVCAPARPRPSAGEAPTPKPRA